MKERVKIYGLMGILVLFGCAPSPENELTSLECAKLSFEQGNYEKALVMAQKGGQSNRADTYYLLGYMHFFGHGVPADRQQAMKYFRRAAAKGHRRAREALQCVQDYRSSKIQRPTVKHFPASTKLGGCRPWSGTDEQGYTLQVASFLEKHHLHNFCQQHSQHGLEFYMISHQNRFWYVVTHGQYQTVQDAKQALWRLPMELKFAKPFVKPVRAIYKERR